jgi:hypothetical protein
MSTETVVTSENLTFDIIKSWDGPTMKRYMASPLREAIKQVVQTQSLEAVEQAQAQINARSADQLTDDVAVKMAEEEALRVAAAEAETQRIAAEAEAVKNKKIVVEYQIKDEEGNPIGRPTHLEATSDEEMRTKMIEAHTQATRAFHRLKKQKVQSLREVNQPISTAPTMSDADLLAAVKDLKSDDPKVALEAHRKLNAAEVAKANAEADAKVAVTNELRRQEKVSFDFLKAHQKDFNNCEANVNLIKNYFQENELAWTSDNLEIAFHALENELAPVAAPVIATPPANPVPAAVVPATSAAVQAQPVPAAPVTPVLPANPVPAQSRPGVNGGIIPGQNSAVRPAVTSKGLTMDEINSWDGPTMRAKMRNPQQRTEIERVVAEAKIKRGR